MIVKKQEFVCEGGPWDGKLVWLWDHTGLSGTLPMQIGKHKGLYIRNNSMDRKHVGESGRFYIVLTWEAL